MRILQVIEFLTPQMGGSPMIAYQISRQLAQRGHEVTVVTSNYGKSRFPQGPFQVIFQPNLIARWGFYVTPGLIPWARENLQAFEMIHLHTARTFQNIIIGHYARQYGMPYLLQAHGTLPVIVARKPAKRLYDFLFGRRVVAEAHGLIAVSPLERDQYLQYGVPAKKISLVPNGLDLEEYSHLPPKGSYRSASSIAVETHVILSVGRIHQLKGLDHLIRAFARLHKISPNSLLVIAGPDEGDLPRLERLVSGMDLQGFVRFPGPLYGEQKLAALVDADVVTSTSYYESFGLVPFEALMCGTPVVVSREIASGQLIATANAGYLVPYGDEETLCNSLLHVLTSPEEALARVASGQAYVRQHLDWQVIITQIEQLYATYSGHRDV
jgi:glycosyltransferase involved in cell wall biosynthesis